MNGTSAPEQEIAGGHRLLLAEQRAEITPGARGNGDTDAAKLKDVSLVDLKPMPSLFSAYLHGKERRNRHINAGATLTSERKGDGP